MAVHEDIAAFVWWVKRTISNAVVKSRSPDQVHDVYEAAQDRLNDEFGAIQQRIEAMDEGQVRAIQRYIYQTIERREKITAGKPNDLEAMKAQETDDEDLKAALVPGWMDLV